MSQFPEHADAIQRELSQLHQQIQQNKERIEQMKSDNSLQSKQVQNMIEQHQNGTKECGTAQKQQEKLFAFQAQYLPMVPPEIQILITAEIEKTKQQLQVEMQASVMNGMMGGVPMPAAAMMMVQAQAAQAAQAQAVQAAQAAQAAQAQAAAAQSQARNNMMGASPRLNKPNGMPNGMNGMAAMAMQNQMMAHMPPGMAQQLQAMAAFSGMGMAIPAMPGFNPAQMAALQGMNGMHPMMPPMSAPSQAAAAAAMAQAAAMAPHMNLSVSTPSRNHSNGPLSGTRTPQAMNSPRPTITHQKEEQKEKSPEEKKQISPTSDDTVAVA